MVPLSVVSGAFLFLHYRWTEADGLFVNLATEIAGIVITVAYVDWIVRRQDAERWRGMDARVTDRVNVFVNALVSGLREALGFGPEILNESETMTGDPERIHREVLRVAEHVLVPAAPARLAGLDEAGWKRLATHLQSVWTEADRILDRFGHRLAPGQVELLLDIQRTVDSSLVFWRTFPELAGVADDKLPETKTPPEILKAHGYDSTAADVQKLLRYAVQLSAETT